MLRKCIVLIVILVTLVTILPACKPDTSLKPQYTPPDENMSDIDLKGRTIVMKGAKYAVYIYGLKPTGDPSSEIDRTLKRVQTAQDKFNFVLNVEAGSTGGDVASREFTSSSLAGIKYCDIFYNISSSYIYPQIKAKIIYPIDTIFDFLNDPIYNTRYLRTTAQSDNRIYGLGTMQFPNPEAGILYNKDIIDELKLKDPMDLYNQGNWDWDSFFELAQRATQDTDKDGTIDQWGINNDSINIYNTLLISNGAKIANYDQENGYYLAIEQPASMNALKKIHDIFLNFGVANPNPIYGNSADKSFNNGKSLFYMDAIINDAKRLNAEKKITKLRWITLPRGPDNPNGSLIVKKDGPVVTWSTSNKDDWENVIKATSWIFTYWDYRRYPDYIQSIDTQKQKWIDETKAYYPYDDANLKFIASLKYDQGTENIKWYLSGLIVSTISRTVYNDISKGYSAEESIGSRIDQCNELLKVQNSQ